jgi:thiamine biosynthesis lipoprotein
VIGVDAVMGTAIRVEIVGETGGAILDEIFAWFREVDERFSMFRDESEMNRLAHGLLGVDDVHPHVREVLGMCEAVRVASRGAFDARHHRRDGLLDPTGLVKGWSVDRAAIILTGEGFADWSINAGGDILVHGRPDTSEAWQVGIQHPRERDAAAAIIDVSDGAVATSGNYERGGHITDARCGAQPGDLLSATVVGRELALADAYATAAFAMGADAVPWLASLRGYDGCVITSDDRVIWTGGLGTTAVSRS